jgi:adenylosuccinate synthase
VKRAVITVGLGFGDEGKGVAVDFLARELEAELVVRYCGGSQAGHNVELPDGRRHTFSQFGAGTLAPHCPRTYLGPAVVIDPPAMHREARHLEALGVADPHSLVTVHPSCLVTTPWLKLLNRLRELHRGDARHGSCGQGIGEARHYWLRYGRDAVTAADLLAPDGLRDKLELQRQRVLLEAQPLIAGLPADGGHDLGGDVWDTSAEDLAGELTEPLALGVTTAADVPAHRTAILEGAQGVLLDEYRGFPPYTTWSTVTPHHAWELVGRMGSEAVAVLGITRSYATRHGAGPLPTYSADLTGRLADPGNPWNRWQGAMRCGWPDLPLLRYAAAAAGPLDGLVVNHVDHTAAEGMVCVEYRDGDPEPAAAPNLAWQERLTKRLESAEPVVVRASIADLLDRLGNVAPVVVTGTGPTHADRTCSGLKFRTKRAGP